MVRAVQCASLLKIVNYKFKLKMIITRNYNIIRLLALIMMAIGFLC